MVAKKGYYLKIRKPSESHNRVTTVDVLKILVIFVFILICFPFSAIPISLLFEVGFGFTISKPFFDFIGTLDGLVLQVTN